VPVVLRLPFAVCFLDALLHATRVIFRSGWRIRA